MKRIIISAFGVMFCLLSSRCEAQTIKTISAVSRSWSGGIAGHSGIHYYFNILFTNTDSITLDSIWVEDFVFPLVVDPLNDYNNANTKVTKINRTTKKYSISISTFHDEYAERQMPVGTPVKPHPVPPVAYKGVALLSYTKNGKMSYYTIKAITKSLEPVNYP